MYLGIDIGTTATKAILIDDAETVVARGETSYPTSRPAPGLCEQDPALWIAAVRSVAASLRQRAPAAMAAVRGLGLSGQMHSLVALGGDDAPLLPAILWNDARGTEECGLLAEAVPDIGTLTGVIPMPSFTAAKLLWLRRHRRDLFEAIRRVMLPKDYVRFWLTGERAGDMSDAAGAQLLDGAERRWAMPVIEAIGLPASCLPQLVEGSTAAGRLRSAVADELGLPAGIPVAAGGGDAAMGAVGLGCMAPGASFISLGTGATFVVTQDRFAPRPAAVLHDFAHALPGLWYQMAAMLNGASSLAWAARLLGEADVGTLLARVEARHQGPSRVLFLPYLTGERTPHNDVDARGTLHGLDPEVDGLDIAQAVIEGVAFSLADAAAALDQAGCRFDDPGLTGGGARSLLWSRIIATVLGRPVLRYEGADLGPALGAARFGMIVGAGAHPAEVVRPPSQATVIEPMAGLQARYAAQHARYRAAYQALKDV